jgi:hypothetical protein
MRDRGVVLSLCDLTGNMVRPWAEAGYECICVDIEKGEPIPGVKRVRADVRWWMPPVQKYAMVFAAPPCTHLAVSGARYFREKGLFALAEGISTVAACAQICLWTKGRWMLENPVGVLGSYWRRWNYTFNPNEYSGYHPTEEDRYTKKTCLWTSDKFVMPARWPRPASNGSAMWKLPPSDDREYKRAVTPLGFAYAVFWANAALPGSGVTVTAGGKIICK